MRSGDASGAIGGSRTIRLGLVPRATSVSGTLRPTAVYLVMLALGCRLLARSRSAELSNECPMLGVKQTSKIRAVTSAFDAVETVPAPDDELR